MLDPRESQKVQNLISANEAQVRFPECSSHLWHIYPNQGAGRRFADARMVGLWHEELAHQTKLDKSEAECLERFLAWWGYW